MSKSVLSHIHTRLINNVSPYANLYKIIYTNIISANKAQDLFI